jgi:hypothetical protein
VIISFFFFFFFFFLLLLLLLLLAGGLMALGMRVMLSPSRIGEITPAALVLSQFEHKMIT